MRDQRAVDQRVAGPDVVAGVDAQVLAVRDEVLAARCRSRCWTMIVRLPRRFSSSSSTRPSISAMTAGLLGPAGLEELGDARQTAGDVLRAADLARGLGQQRAGRRSSGRRRLRCWRLLGDVVEVEDLALVVLDDDLRVQVALVLDDRAADVAARGRSRPASSRPRRCRRSGPCRRPRRGSG